MKNFGASSPQEKRRDGGGSAVFLCLLFTAALFTPLLDAAFFHFSAKFESTENRTMAKRPAPDFSSAKKLRNFPKEYETYFNDNFGFRNLLVKAASLIQLKWLGVSPEPMVLVGKQGWYYYNGDTNFDGAPVAGYRGLALHSQRNLQSVKRNLERQKKWLEDRGIRYAVMIAPDKPTIYPEYMPDRIRVVHQRTRTDQLLSYLKKSKCRVQIIDLREELRKAKSLYPTYYKTDHHWNRFGGFLAAQALVKDLSRYFPELEPFTLSNYEITREPQPGVTDLANMLALPRQLDDEEILFRLKLETLPEGAYKRKSPRLLIFHESFMNAVFPFLFDHFRYIYETRWASFGMLDYRMIEKLKPDAVVLEIEESYQSAFV